MRLLALLLSLCILSTSCVVMKPDSMSVTQPDYNQRVEVKDAHYHHQITPVGYTSIGLTTAAGGYYGYSSNLITYYSNGERKTLPAANAVIGALTGFTTSYLINRALGWGKVTKAENPNEWVKKANKSFRLISSQSNNYWVVNSSAEPNYIVKNPKDAQDFITAFPGSKHSDNAMKSGVELCRRNEMPELIRCFSQSKFVFDAKVKYVRHSATFEELDIAAKQTYPNLGIDLESDYLGLIRTLPHGFKFLESYPSTKHRKEVVVNSFSMPELDASRLQNFRAKLASDFTITSSDIDRVPNPNRRNYMNALVKLENPKADRYKGNDVVLDFFAKYPHIKYPERGFDALSWIWDLYYDYYRNGNDLIGQIHSVTRSNSEGITSKTVNELLDSKLALEVDKVRIQRENMVSNSDKSWEEWKKFKTWDAPFVVQSGEVKYIEYGYVKNTSKFDLPVRIDFSLPLYRSTSGKVFGILDAGTNTSNIATKNQSYYIKVAKAGEQTPYAVLFDFGSMDQNVGVKILWSRVSTEIQPGSTKSAVQYNRYNFPPKQINEQKDWLTLAMHGFGNKQGVADFMNIFGGLSYNPQDYEKAWTNERSRVQNYNCSVDYWNQVVKHNKAGEYEKAKNSLLSALECKGSERDAKTYDFLSYVCYRLGFPEEALDYANKALADNNFTISLTIRGNLNFERAKYFDAIQDYTRALKVEETAELYTLRAAVYILFEGLSKNVEADVKRAEELITDDDTLKTKLNLNQLKYQIELSRLGKLYNMDELKGYYKKINFGLDNSFKPIGDS